jgi:hypothetical protein
VWGKIDVRHVVVLLQVSKHNGRKLIVSKTYLDGIMEHKLVVSVAPVITNPFVPVDNQRVNSKHLQACGRV